MSDKSKKLPKSCGNCENRRFGFPSETLTGDACDWTCNLDGNTSNLLCTHYLSDKQVADKLSKMGNKCKRWIEKKRSLEISW